MEVQEVKRKPGRPRKIRPEDAMEALQENDLGEFLLGCAERLELALAIRIGAMDSQSRVDDLTNQMRAVVSEVARDLRAAA